MTESKKIINIRDKDQKRANPSFDNTLRNQDIQVDSYNNIIKVFQDKQGVMKFAEIGKAMNIVNISKNIESEEISYDIQIQTFDDRKMLIKGLKRKDLLDRNEILALTSYGAEVNSGNAKYYAMNFENQERLMSGLIKNIHENVGWIQVDGKNIFIHEEAIGDVDSEYQGELEIETKGTLEGWYNLLKEEVLGHVALEACIAIALSAVVVGFIGD